MRFGISMLGVTTILFGTFGIALKDAHPQSAADSRVTPLILEKNEENTALEDPERLPYLQDRSRLRLIATMEAHKRCLRVQRRFLSAA